MRILSIQPNLITNKTKYNSNQNVYQPSSFSKNINFGITPEYYVLRTLLIADKYVSQSERTKVRCFDIIKNKIKESFPELLKELKALNSNSDSGFIYKLASRLAIVEKAPKKIKDLKQLTLEEVLSIMDDSNTDCRVAKKDFMMSLVDSGEYLNQAFLKQFIAMPSKYYGSLKEDIAEKSLHITLKNPELTNKAPDVYLFNLAMLRSMMTPEHQGFFNLNKDEVSQLFKKIETISKWKLTEKYNSAFYSYIEDFENQKNWKNLTSDLFKKELIESGFNKENLAKRLLISEEFANILLKELQIIAHTKTGIDKEQKIEEYRTLIDELLKCKFLGTDEITEPLYKKKAIEKFIKSSDCKEDLLNIYRQDLNHLEISHNIAKTRSSYSENYDNLESWERAELEAPWIVL